MQHSQTQEADRNESRVQDSTEKIEKRCMYKTLTRDADSARTAPADDLAFLVLRQLQLLRLLDFFEYKVCRGRGRGLGLQGGRVDAVCMEALVDCAGDLEEFREGLVSDHDVC